METAARPSIDVGADAALAPYVPELLLDWPDDRTWQLLEGTLVSADISGFTALSERLADRGREGSEELSALICGCFDGMIDDCATRGGDIVKFGGDALLVWFSGDGHAQRACLASIAMRQTLRQRRTTSDGKRVRLAVSIGLHAGSHAFFTIRSGYQDLVVTGPGATMTVDAESAATAGEILLTHATAQQVPPSWLGEHRAEGVVLARASSVAPRHRDGRPSSSLSGDTGPSDHGATRRRSPSEFVPAEQQPQILAGAANEHRQVAISFVEFSETDELVASGHPDELARRLQRLADSIAAACAMYGVFLLSTDVYHNGGKFVLTAGAPLSLGGDDERLLRAVRDVIDSDPELHLRAGVNRGYVFAGDLGSVRRRTYTVMGDAMNLSARLMARADAGEVIVSRPTMEWASSRFEYAPLDPFFVKGKQVPIYAGRLGKHLGRRTDVEQTDSALCGRDDELALLSAFADAAESFSGSVVVITGEPGIGKSRLALEVVADRKSDGVVLARCQPFDRLSAYSVTEPIIRALLGIEPDASASAAGEALGGWLADRLPSHLPLAPLLAFAIGADVPDTPEADAVVPAFRRVRTLQLLSDVVVGCVDSMTVLIIDDIQNADDATRELVEALAIVASEIPLLVIATSVPEETLGGERIALSQLDERDVTAMIDSLLGDRAISSSTVRSIVQRAAGNPLFVSELLRALSEDPDASIPSSLESLVEARIDQLDAVDRKLLRNASVLGPTVDIVLLAQMSDDDLVRRPDRWDRLDRFLERVGPGVVRFRYDTYHRVVYDGLSYRTRRNLHRRVFDVLESDLTDDREQLARLAFHAQRSGDGERTWRYGTAAAVAASDAALFGEAARLYGMALDAQSSAASADELAVVAERAGDVFEIAGLFEAAERTFALSTRWATEPIVRARLWRKRAYVAERRGDLGRATTSLARAARALSHVGWAHAIAESASWAVARSVLAMRQSRFDEAWNFATSALSKAELVGDWPTAAHAGLMVDNLVTHLRWDGIEVLRPDVVELYRRAHDPVGEAKYLSNRAVDHYFDGDWREAVRLYRESAQKSADYGHAVSEATCLNNIAEILSDQGRYDDASTMFREASRSWRSIGYGIGIALAEANLGRLATRTLRFDEADELLRSSIDRFRQLDAATFVSEVTLRAIENQLIADRDLAVGALDVEWPSTNELDAEPTLHIYADRLRACASVDDIESARAAIDSSIHTARSAGVPYELALSLRVRAMLTGDSTDRAESEAIFEQLEVVAPPPLPARWR